MGIGSGIDGLTTSVRNETGHAMTVRQVAFLIGETFIVLLPSGELTSSFKGKDRKLTRAEMRRLKGGAMIPMESEMQFASWRVPPTEAGFVTLPPYTKTSFLLPAEFIAANSTDDIRSYRVVLEYETRAGEKKILQNDVKPSHPDHVRSTLQHFRAEVQNGTLDKARKMFGKPSIGPKPASADSNQATLLLPNDTEIALKQFDLSLGQLVGLAQQALNDPKITPEGFGTQKHFFFVNSTTGSLFDSHLDLSRQLSTLFVSNGDVIELRLCQPNPQSDTAALNPMRGVTKYVK